jgi:chromosome partitioning protein
MSGSAAGQAAAAPVSATDLSEEGEAPYEDDDSTPLAAEAQEHVDLARRVQDTAQLPKPAETRVMVVANQKGGVGKTTTAVNIAAALATKGLRVLVVDLDPQGNASTALNIDHSEGTPGVYEALVDGTDLDELVRPCPDHPGLTVLPASIDLAGAEIELVSLVARETRLDKTLQSYLADCQDAGDRIDYVLIDCPPSLGLLTVNALVAGREVLIPIQCEYYALEGLGQLVRNIDLVQRHLNPNLNITTILLTMYDARTRLSAGVADEVRNFFGDKVLRTAIPRSVRISEAPSYQQTILTYDAASSGALSYLEAAREIAVSKEAG